MTGRVREILLTAGVLLAVHGVAVAQDDTTGPLVFSIEGAVEFSDNRDATPVGESNFDLLVRPKVATILEWDKTQLDFSYAPAFRYRTDPSSVQNDTELQHAVAIMVGHELSRVLKVRFSENFDLTDDPSIQEQGTTLRRDVSYTWNRIGAGLNYQFSRLANVDVSVRNAMKRYDASAVAIEADKDSTEAGLVVWRQMSRTLGIMGVVRAVDYGYEDTETLERGFLSMFLGAGVEKQLGKDLRVGVRIGFQTSDYDNSSLDSADSPYIIVQINGSTVPSLRFNGQLRYVTRDADVYPYSSQEYTGVSGGVEWDASPRVMMIGALAFGIGEYTAEGTPSAAGAAFGDETTMVGSLGAVYKISETTSVRLTQSYEDVDTDISLPFTRNATRLAYMKRF